MKVVVKFGGTSVQDDLAMRRSADIAIKRKAKVTLVSATSGTTNQLVKLALNNLEMSLDSKLEVIDEIKKRHIEIAGKLGGDDLLKDKILYYIENLTTLIRGTHLLKDCSPKFYDRIVSIGELMSSTLFTWALSEKTNKKVEFFDIRKILKTNSRFMRAEPLIDEIKKYSNECLDLNNEDIIYVAQGFIGQDLNGTTTTLGRGGSDYSAALVAEGIEADHLEIWTDVEGVKTTDPRVCKNTCNIMEMTFTEASELANFGAKVLHPTTLWPSLRSGFPVFVGSTLNPDGDGTWIRHSTESSPLVRGISFKENQAVMIISTPVMSQSYGFLSQIFDIFKTHEISIDVVTTSEISVAVTIDQSILDEKEFIADLEELGSIQIEKDLSLVSVIGNRINHTPGVLKKILTTLDNINIRAISGGASKHNVNFLVPNTEVKEVICSIHKGFLE